jgi:TPR repeat protein
MHDANAIHKLGSLYHDGGMGLQQDKKKANKLWLRAGELGNAMAYNNVGVSYERGEGVQRDTKKANHYYELAAIGGNVKAMYNLGIFEERIGNTSRAVKHFMIAAGSGHDKSLKPFENAF